MAEQKRRAKEARKREGVGDDGERYAELLEQFGPTEFTGRDEYESKARVLAMLDDARRRASASSSIAHRSTRSRVVRSATSE